MESIAPVCPTCRYELTGLTTPRCPECGRTFTEEEWSNPTLLRPMLAWERRKWVNVVWAFWATFFAMLFRPRTSLRRLRVGDRPLGAVGYFLLLIPASWALAAIVSVSAASCVEYLTPWLRNPAYWKGHLWAFEGSRNKWLFVAYNGVRVAIHCTAFPLAILVIWLPALVFLDAVFRRERAPFRLFAKALLYLMTWSAVVVALASTVVRAIIEQFETTWSWGESSGSIPNPGEMPWISWIALALFSLQCGFMLWFVRSDACAFREADGARGRWAAWVIALTWISGVYLLLLDRHVHLRFHLLYVNEELGNWYRPLFRGL